MTFAAVPEWVTDVGVYAATLTAVITALAAGSKTRPGRWLLRAVVEANEFVREHLEARRRRRWVAQLDELMPRYLAPVLAELRPNGGSSFRDEVRADRAIVHAQINALNQKLDEHIRISRGETT